MLARARGDEVHVAIVTTSVSYYAEAMCRHHAITYDLLVAYHDVTRAKPDSECFVRALTALGIGASRAVGVGDSWRDADSLRGAGVRAIGAGWSPALDVEASWYEVVPTPDDVLHALARVLRH